MTQDEARTVLNIMMTADKDCCSCASELALQFVAQFPEHRAVADEVYSANCTGPLE